MTKYLLEFDGGSNSRYVIVDDGYLSDNPLVNAQGDILTDGLVENFADAIAIAQSKTLYGIWRVNNTDQIV